jgi:hypothetical protein
MGEAYVSVRPEGTQRCSRTGRAARGGGGGYIKIFRTPRQNILSILTEHHTYRKIDAKNIYLALGLAVSEAECGRVRGASGRAASRQRR